MSASAVETQIAKENRQALLIYAISATVFTVCFSSYQMIFLSDLSVCLFRCEVYISQALNVYFYYKFCCNVFFSFLALFCNMFLYQEGALNSASVLLYSKMSTETSHEYEAPNPVSLMRFLLGSQFRGTLQFQFI